MGSSSAVWYIGFGLTGYAHVQEKKMMAQKKGMVVSDVDHRSAVWGGLVGRDNDCAAQTRPSNRSTTKIIRVYLKREAAAHLATSASSQDGQLWAPTTVQATVELFERGRSKLTAAP